MVSVQYRKVLLLSTVLLVLPDASAQTGSTDDSPGRELETSADDAGMSEAAPPIEVGPGGEITLERKQRTEMESLFGWHTHFLWESRYVTEGRDNLSGDGLASVSSEFIIGEANFLPWYAYGPGADYSELNLNFIYGILPTEDLAVYFGYNHIRARYLGEGANDNEISLDLVHKLIKHLAVAASIYHSFDASGSFMEMAVKYFDAPYKRAHYSVQAGLGVNAGYVSDGHTGLNNFQLRANVSYLPVIQVELYAYTGYSAAINRDAVRYAGDELLGDFFWGGVGFVYVF
jgi:hypothetical protein